MNTKMLRPLTTWPFLLSLVTLLINDRWLKAAYPNMLTGKLSDFAGLAVVALLLFSGVSHRKWLLGWVIAGAFLWWKSPFSEVFIHAVNRVSPLPIGRTVNYGDLWALLVLPLCLRVTRVPVRAKAARFRSKKVVPWLLAMVALLAIMGTSMNF